MADEIVLYRSVGSRSFTSLWMLEELGLPYRMETRDLRKGENRNPDYLKLNPMGKVPTLMLGDVVVWENPAICMLLADRYGYGTLAPRIEEADRGAYLQWMVFATSVLEPARALREVNIDTPPGAWGGGWGTMDQVTEVLIGALRGRSFLLGERFSAADVMLGSTISVSLFTNTLPADPVLTAYNDRISARPACQKASALNWPPELFPPSPA
ncbi:MAG: glutathione S-transferase family protein [Caulobacterales bacterium]